MRDFDADDLAAELSDFAAPEKQSGRPAREELVIAGFEEILGFVDKHGRAPQHGEDRDIFERLYAVRLDRIRAQEGCRAFLVQLDRHALLAATPAPRSSEVEFDIDGLAAELAEVASGEDITVLRYVRANADKRAADDIGQRTPCVDFESFKPLFDVVRREMLNGVRTTLAVQTLDKLRLTEIQSGEFFIVDGQIAYVADVGEVIRTKYERRDSRLRVIYDNGTESDVLQRSFQRALYRDETARLVTNPSAGPLFAAEVAEDDWQSGTIYVARSKSELPAVAACRDVLHKIGVTGQSKVSARVADAKNDPTFLLAEVEVIATYDLYNVNRVKLEALIHRVFDSARLDIEIKDRFGKPVQPREWFLVPLFIIDEAVKRIIDGSITEYAYDPQTGRLARQ